MDSPGPLRDPEKAVFRQTLTPVLHDLAATVNVGVVAMIPRSLRHSDHPVRWAGSQAGQGRDW